MASPKAPSFMDKANTVTNLWHNPCNAPWTVYVETALPVIGNMALRLIDFGMGDIIRGAARPRALREKSKKDRSRKGGRKGGGIPELGNLIGKNIPGADELEGRKITAGQKALWVLDGALQRVFWNWLVADIIGDGLYNWSSAIMSSSCDEEIPFGSANSESIDDATFFTPGNAWLSIPSGNVLYEVGQATSRFGAFNNGGAPFQCMAGIQADVGALPNGFIQIGVRVPGGAAILASGSANQPQNVVANLESSGLPLSFAYRTNGGSFKGKAYTVTFGF